LWLRLIEAAALSVAATKASFRVIRIKTHAKFITNGIETQWALGLKSLPKATGTPPRQKEKKTKNKNRNEYSNLQYEENRRDAGGYLNQSTCEQEEE
jgi:ribonuclease HI